MAISQQQIVDYLNKKLGYGVAKTDVYTAKSPSNEGNASPLLSVGNTIWQLSNLIPTSIPASSDSIVSVYADSLSTTVQCTVDNTTSITNETWRTNLTDWIPPQFGSTYQVKVYAAPAGTLAPQTTGTQLFPDGSGNNDGWFFDYQAGILNFADTTIPTAVAGNSIYIVGARYVGQKGISNFPLGLSMGNVLISGNAIAGNLITTSGLFWANGTSALGTFSNTSLAAYLSGNITAGNITTGNLSTTNGVFWANGVNYSSNIQGLYGNANVGVYLPYDATIISILGNLGGLTANAGSQATSLSVINANLGVTSGYINSLLGITSGLEVQLNYAVSTANTNTAAYLAAGVSTVNVTGNSTVGGNLTVYGNLIVQGNVYELQTEIITQNEIVAGSLYAGAYFYANGTPFNYGNVQVAAYLPTYTGPLGSSDITTLYANAVQQANQITGSNNRVNVLDANLGTTTTNITTLLANAGVQAGQIQVLDANLGTVSTSIGQLTSNAASQAIDIVGLRANIISANANISLLFANVAGITNNLGWLTSNVNSINANLGAYQIYANANLGVTSLALNSLQNSSGAYQIYANANLGTATTNISALQANLGAYQIFANANVGTISVNLNSLLANVGAYQIFANANVGAYQIFANANAAAQQVAINSLASSANANVAAYLLKNTVVVGGSAEATSANTGVLQVWAGASIGANLYVGGNLIVAGNSYVLQTEILTQNEVITGNIYAGAYFFANGAQFVTSSYSNANVASYLPTYSGNLSPGNLTVRGNLYVANIITSGTFGNINNVDTIAANNFIFSGNGVNIINAILNQTYSNTNTQAYLSGTVSIGNIITANGLFWSNGVSALTPTYGNTQVAAYLPTYAGNINPGNVNTTTVTASTVNTATIVTGNITAGNVMSNNEYTGALRVTANATVGNIIASQFFWANGVVFSSSNYGNANVATYLAGFGSNLINTTGNVTVGNLISSGNVYGQTFVGNVSTTGNITARYIQTSGAYGNITGANVISANSFVFGSNGVNILSTVTGTYSNANVQSYMANFGSNVITTTGNITAGNFNSAGNITVGSVNTDKVTTNSILSNSHLYANGVSILSGIGGTYSNSNVQSYMANFGSNVITTTGAVSAGNVTASNLIATANAYITGNLTVYGTINVANIVVTNTEVVYVTEQVRGNANVSGNTSTGNLLTDGLRYANGNPYQFGSTYSNANVASYLPVYSGNLSTTNITTGNIVVTNNVTTANITIQNLTTVGSYGNITGANVISANAFVFGANGVNILAAVATAAAGIYSNANVASYLPVYSGNVSAGNVLTNNLLYANGNPYSFGSTYSNANVAAYLAISPVITGIQANLGAYQIYANANVGAISNTVNTLSANIGTYQIATNANLGAYQIYANANAATQATSINTISANLGAYEAWANVNFGTSSYSNVDVAAYMAAGTGTLVVATGAQASAANTGALRVWGGASVGANLYVAGNLIVQGNSYVLQTEILASNEVVSNSIYAQSYFYANGTPLNYGNVQVAAYLATNTDPVISNLNANAAVQATALNTLNANVGAYYIYANANLGTATTNINSINANLGAYENTTNANLGTATTNINLINANLGTVYTHVNTLDANVGAYETWANATFSVATGPTTSELSANIGSYQIYSNANVGTISTALNTLTANVGAYENATNANLGTATTNINSINANVGAYENATNANLGTATTNINSINANVGAFEIYANANIGTIFSSVNSTNANLGAYQTYANANAAVQAVAINSLYTNANANTAAYLLTSIGNISAGNITVSGNVTSGNVQTNGLYYANGVAYVFGSTYSNANVASYLPTYSGNITAGNVISRFYGNINADTIIAPNGNLTLTPVNNQITVVNSSSALQLPKGPNSARPTGQPGFLRFNTDYNSIEYYDGGKWQSAINSITEQLLTGDGVSKDFTLDQLTNAVGILVSINGTVQTPNVAYTVSGTQITFAEAPQATDYVDVRYLVSASATIADVMIVDSGNVAVGTGTVTVDYWSLTDYRSAKYVISSSTGTESQITEILLTHNGSAGFISNTTLKTGVNRIDFTASVSSGNVLLQAVSTTTGNQLRIQRTYFDI